MMGSFLTRGLVMVFGYAYPAYECYKTVDMNKPDIAQLRFWCQYWILVAMLTVFERVGDTFISWIPMYSEAKLAFIIYLWCPKTKGSTYVYESFFRPLVAQHENEIDRSLSEWKTQASDLVVLYGQKAITYGQTRVFDVLRYVASQSNPTQGVVKKQDEGVTNRKETSKPVTTAERPVPLPRTSSNQKKKKKDEDVSVEDASHKHEATLSSAGLKEPAPAAAPAPTETSKTSTSNETKALEIDSAVSKENAEPNLQGTVIEEMGRVTRARSRKTHTPTK